MRLRGALTPIISRLSRKEVIDVDPLTEPTLMRGIGQVNPIAEEEDSEEDANVRSINARFDRQEMSEQEALMERMGQSPNLRSARTLIDRVAAPTRSEHSGGRDQI